ncbi:transcriptional repressor [Aeromonas caviae]|uniref:transcriptional repressor n=2 Tax=Aeromonas caviae TaxID=648 RepID=UPI00191E3B5D|nr:transcriptional repressor [Aeromonas caviae]MBL0580048.1 transcriptional repressor [Aeromonas caviae]
MSMTENQERVLVALQQAQQALGAYDLLERLRRPGFSSPTQIYRALDQLIQHGLVYRLETLNAYISCSPLGDCRSRSRAFAICDSCGQVNELLADDLTHHIQQGANRLGFALGRVALEIHGQCTTCTRLAQFGR